MGIFSDIPSHNQMDVLKKLEFQDFVRFRKCSEETMEMTKNFGHKLYLKMDELCYDEDSLYGNDRDYDYEWFTREPVRLRIEDFQLNIKMTTEGFCMLEEFSQKTKLVAPKLHFYAQEEEDRNDGPTIDKLIKLLNVTILRFEYYCSSVLSKIDELKNIEDICFAYGNSPYSGGTKDFDYQLLTQPKISFFDTYDMDKPFTPHVIRTFLKEWTESMREIKHISADFKGNLMEACNDLEISLLWSPQSRSLFETQFETQPAGIRGRRGRLLRIYSIEREMDKKKLFCISWEFYLDRARIERMDVREYEKVEDIQEWIRSSMWFPM